MPDDVRLIRSGSEIALARSDRQARDAADAERVCALAATDRIGKLLDRDADDSGDDPDALGAITDELQCIEQRLRALFGEPVRRLMRDGRTIARVRS